MIIYYDVREVKMTEHDKLALLNMINKASEALQHVIAAEEDDDENDLLSNIDYFKIKSCWHGIIHALINEAEAKGCKVIWEDYKAVKIEEKGEKNDRK
jgi:hypothetical protein